jgi:hypothetical protein
MKKMGVVVTTALSAAMVIAGFCCAGQMAIAQSPSPGIQDQMQQTDNQKAASETRTFEGKIVKAGKLLVLSDTEGKTTYKLDDQQKAKEYVNKDVKVTGVLDASTGMIHVTVIDPA